jgi:subtilase family serine protease
MRRLNLECLEDRTTPTVTNPNPVGLDPAQVQHAYGFDQIPALAGNYDSAGAGQTIAVVMAGHDPNISSDLHVFSQTFGLPDASLIQLNETGSTTGPWTSVNTSWAAEISLDVEWAHAIAPSARIVLVESNSANLSDLVAAINTARNYPGVSAVSMSWGLLQGTGMNNYQQYFTTPPGHTPITFVASTLDNGQSYPGYLYWPSVSPNVIAVGGTSLTLDASGNYQGETGWGPSTGGISTWFAQPAYQNGIVTQSTKYRTVPDVSYAADNTTDGFAVYDTVPYQNQTGWFDAGGDSAGSPQWAALVAIADQERVAAGGTTLDGPSQVLPALYDLAKTNYSTYFHDITTGGNAKYSAGVGYDLVTGLGTPLASAIVPALAGLTGSGTSVSFATPTAGSPGFGGVAQVGGSFAVDVVSPGDANLPPEGDTDWGQGRHDHHGNAGDGVAAGNTPGGNALDQQFRQTPGKK